jgi:hypothetical protein
MHPDDEVLLGDGGQGGTYHGTGDALKEPVATGLEEAPRSARSGCDPEGAEVAPRKRAGCADACAQRDNAEIEEPRGKAPLRGCDLRRPLAPSRWTQSPVDWRSGSPALPHAPVWAAPGCSSRGARTRGRAGSRSRRRVGRRIASAIGAGELGMAMAPQGLGGGGMRISKVVSAVAQSVLRTREGSRSPRTESERVRSWVRFASRITLKSSRPTRHHAYRLSGARVRLRHNDRRPPRATREAGLSRSRRFPEVEIDGGRSGHVAGDGAPQDFILVLWRKAANGVNARLANPVGAGIVRADPVGPNSPPPRASGRRLDQ